MDGFSSKVDSSLLFSLLGRRTGFFFFFSFPPPPRTGEIPTPSFPTSSFPPPSQIMVRCAPPPFLLLAKGRAIFLSLPKMRMPGPLPSSSSRKGEEASFPPPSPSPPKGKERRQCSFPSPSLIFSPFSHWKKPPSFLPPWGKGMKAKLPPLAAYLLSRGTTVFFPPPPPLV